MKKAEDSERVVKGIQCCLGIDDRRCSACPFRRNHGQIDAGCAERMMRAALVAIQEAMLT